MNETPSLQSIISPDDATAVKWTGAATTVAVLILLLVAFGWVVAMLAGVACFGTLLLCVGAESETPRES